MKKSTLLKFWMIGSLICYVFQIGAQTAAQPACEESTLNTQITPHTTTDVHFVPIEVKNGGNGVQANGDRVIFWLHGLGGDEYSWTRAANATQAQISPIFPARKAMCLRPHYSQFDLSNAGVDLHNYLVSQDGFTTNSNPFTYNFLIAHSQGGPVSRKLDYFYNQNIIASTDRRIGGIVTFGSPHMGAEIINNIPLIQPFADEGCAAIAAGPIAEGIAGNKFLNFFYPAVNQTAQQVADGICGFFANQVVPQVFKDALHPITKDYAVGATEITNLNTFQASASSTTPMVAFYGEEEDPLFFRIMYSMSVDDINSHDAFTADYDQQLVDAAQQAFYTYRLHRDIAQATATNAFNNLCPFWETVFPPTASFCLFYDLHWYHEISVWDNVRSEWDKGLSWWGNADDKWRVIIGADETVTGLMTLPFEYCKCTGTRLNYSQVVLSDEEVSSNSECTQMQNPLLYDGNFRSVNCHTYTKNVTGIFTVTNRLPADGVVLAKSAGGLINRQNWPMVKSNHAQMKSDANTRDRLNELYNGTYDPYFYTPLR